MSRGQVEAGFQWVYVLLAGGAILVLLFLIMRGCAQQGEGRVQGIAVQAAASRLQAGAWQLESTSALGVQELEAACIGGVITLSNELSSAPVERTPVFLPPVLKERLSLVTRPFEISEQGSPAIPLGSALYVLDEHTYYIAVQDPDGFTFPLAAENVRTVDMAGVTDEAEIARGIPPTASTVIVVADGGAGLVANAAVQGLPAQARVLGVSVQDGQAEFFSRQSGVMVSLGAGPAENDLLSAGAMVSGDPSLYRCARQHLQDRARTLTTLYSARAEALAGELPVCAAGLSDAVAILERINDDPAYLAALAREQRDLAQRQNTLLLRSCPVIA